MNAFADLVSGLKIDLNLLIKRSAVLERTRADGAKRWRGISRSLVAKALRGEEISRRARGKLVRALQDVAPSAALSWDGRTLRAGAMPAGAPPSLPPVPEQASAAS